MLPGMDLTKIKEAADRERRRSYDERPAAFNMKRDEDRALLLAAVPDPLTEIERLDAREQGDAGAAQWVATLNAMTTPEWHRFAHALLVDPAGGVARFAAPFPALLAAIEGVAALHLRAASGDAPTANEWEDARETARAAYIPAADLGKVTPSAGHAGFVAVLSIGAPRDFFSIHASYVEHIDTPCGIESNRHFRKTAAYRRELQEYSNAGRYGCTGGAPSPPASLFCSSHRGDEALCHADKSASHAACLTWQTTKVTP
jgi:hypothetical protein